MTSYNSTNLSNSRKNIIIKGNHATLLPEDFYLNEQGFMVFTESYHLKRGYCCKLGCKHCPYRK